MKKYFNFSVIYLLMAVVAMGCSEVDQTVDTSIVTGQEITISAEVGTQSKVTVGDDWSLTWDEDDDMLLVSMNDGATAILAMDQYDPAVSTFTGDLPTSCTSFRLATPSAAFASQGTSCTVDLSNQVAGLNNSYMVGSGVTEVVDDSMVGSVSMSHVGAAAVLSVKVDNAPTSSNYVITSIIINDLPTAVTLDMSKSIDDEDFYGTSTTGDITITFDADQESDDQTDDSTDDQSTSSSITTSTTTETFEYGNTFNDGDSYVTLVGLPATLSSFEVKFNTLPFTEDEKIVVDFIYTSTSGSTAKLTKEISGSGTFSRGTYVTIPTTIDFNDLNEDLTFDDAPEPNTTTATVYAPSSLTTYYYPITLKSTSSTSAGATPSTSQKATRILEYMIDFEPDYSAENYQASVNKYGSRIDMNVGGTGRYRTYKDANGRWWIVDPDGYLNIQRGLNSINHDQGNEISGAWASKWGSVTPWLTDVFADFKKLGFNATGAFTKDDDCGYSGIASFSKTAENPLSVAPSLGFLSAFRKSTYNEVAVKYYPDGSTDNDDLEAGLAFYEGWDDFCLYYVEDQVAQYEADADIFGFFSDNELKWNASSLCILTEFLKLTDTTNPAYIAAADFMTQNGCEASTSLVTDELSEAFAGVAARAYYSGVRKALDELGYEILYLGTRLHGTPKQIDAVIQAAGDNCDVISINYYNNWSVANQGSWSAQGVSSFVYNSWEEANAPFLVSEFYAKGADMDVYGMSDYVSNTDGAGWLVTDQLARGCWYQHFTLGLLESTHCVGWHWFRYQDDDEANRGFYDRNYNQWETLSRYAKGLNYNIYNVIDYFDENRFGSN